MVKPMFVQIASLNRNVFEMVWEYLFEKRGQLLKVLHDAVIGPVVKLHVLDSDVRAAGVLSSILCKNANPPFNSPRLHFNLGLQRYLN